MALKLIYYGSQCKKKMNWPQNMLVDKITRIPGANNFYSMYSIYDSFVYIF